MIAGIVLLSGCSAQAAQDPVEDNSYVITEGQTEVYGKIRTVFGNEITLVVGTLQASSINASSESVDSAADNGGGAIGPPASNEISSSSDSAGEMPVMGDSASGPSARSGSGEGISRGGMSGGTGGMGIMNSITLDYTGEEITCQIPVTAIIVSGQEPNTSEIRFTQIAEKSIVRLVLDENGTIVYVQVLS